MRVANRRVAALACMAGVLPVVVLGLQTGGNGAFRQREVRVDVRRAEKPLFVDHERPVQCRRFGIGQSFKVPSFLPAAIVRAVRSTYCNYSPWVRPCHLENGGS